MKTIIIIPTYNERENVSKITSAIFSLLPDISILFVDDNSPDGTAEVVEVLQKKYNNVYLLKRPGKEGLGRAYVDAFKFIMRDGRFDSLIMMDADFSHDPKYLLAMIHEGQNKDLVIGSRYISGGGTEGWEFFRRMLSRWGNVYARFITRISIKDLTAGFNFIRISALKKINLDELGASGYAFQIELKYRLWKTRARIGEVPIIFKNRIEGESKISNHIIKEGVLIPWRLIWRE